MILDFLLSDEPDAPGEYALARYSRRAMATTFEVAIPVGTLRDPLAAAEDALDLIDRLEDQLTVYREHSEVALLNATAADGFVPVERGLFELLARCAAWTRETDGAFDVAAGALIKAWGFYRRDGAVPPAAELVDAMRRTGFRHVVLDHERSAVKFRVPGLELNLGAVGKGYALDCAATLLRRKWGVRSALLHGGGSSVYAVGTPPGDTSGWPINLKHPTQPERSLGVVRLTDAGFGTSAATFQFFEYKGRKLGHLLDPRTGWPADGVASVSAVAPTAAEADAMSTAAFVEGAGAAERLTRLRPALGLVVLGESAEPNPPSPFPKKEGGGAENNVPGRVVGAPDVDKPGERRGTLIPAPPPSFSGKGDGGLGRLRTFNLDPDTYSPPPAD